MNDDSLSNSRSARKQAENVKLPDQTKRRVPVGIILIALWVLVFLSIFMVLAWRKLNPPVNPGPVTPNIVPANPEGAPAPDPRNEP